MLAGISGFLELLISSLFESTSTAGHTGVNILVVFNANTTDFVSQTALAIDSGLTSAGFTATIGGQAYTVNGDIAVIVVNETTGEETVVEVEPDNVCFAYDVDGTCSHGQCFDDSGSPACGCDDNYYGLYCSYFIAPLMDYTVIYQNVTMEISCDLAWDASYGDLTSEASLELISVLHAQFTTWLTGDNFIYVSITGFREVDGLTVVDFSCGYDIPLTSGQMSEISYNMLLAIQASSSIVTLNEDVSITITTLYLSIDGTAVAMTDSCSYFTAQNLCENQAACNSGQALPSCSCPDNYDGEFCQFYSPPVEDSADTSDIDVSFGVPSIDWNDILNDLNDPFTRNLIAAFRAALRELYANLRGFRQVRINGFFSLSTSSFGRRKRQADDNTGTGVNAVVEVEGTADADQVNDVSTGVDDATNNGLTVDGDTVDITDPSVSVDGNAVPVGGSADPCILQNAVTTCQNGGTCVADGDNFYCRCTDSWYGAQCSSPVTVQDSDEEEGFSSVLIVVFVLIGFLLLVAAIIAVFFICNSGRRRIRDSGLQDSNSNRNSAYSQNGMPTPYGMNPLYARYHDWYRRWMPLNQTPKTRPPASNLGYTNVGYGNTLVHPATQVNNMLYP